MPGVEIHKWVNGVVHSSEEYLMFGNPGFQGC